MENTVEIPYPEIERQNQDLSIRQEYEALLAREAKEAEAALAAKLASIDQSGNIEDLLADTKLRIKFVEKYGDKRFGQLRFKHDRATTARKLAQEHEQKMSRRTWSTTQGRLAELNKARKAAAGSN